MRLLSFWERGSPVRKYENYLAHFFSSPIRQKAHILNRTHTGENPFPCSLYRKAFSQNVSLKENLRTHSVEKTCPCNQCPKAFSQSGNLKQHLRIHSVEKPYPCNQYPTAFSGNSDFKKHMRTQTLSWETISLWSMS